MIQLPAIEEGVHRDILPGRYHGIKWAASASQLRELHGKTPAHLYHRLQNPKPPTWEMILGTLVHHRILEPTTPFPAISVVPETYVVPADYKGTLRDPKPGDVEKWNWRRKHCQQWQQIQEAAGFIVVDRSDLDEIERASERVLANREARELLEGADTEVTLFWNHQHETGPFPCKARLDMVPLGGDMGDLKTCADASPNRWEIHAWDNGYHLQAAFYMDAWDLLGTRMFTGFKFIAYERSVGLVKVHRISDELLQIGREAYQSALDTYIRCVRANQWPGYSEDVAVWDVPRWMRKGAL
jgi:PDDEXK-like domain of unknown function (DUF3799)